MMPMRPRVLMASGRRLFCDPAGADPGHRVADHPEVERAEAEPDAGAEAQERLAEGDAGHQGGHPDHQHHRPRCAGPRRARWAVRSGRTRLRYSPARTAARPGWQGLPGPVRPRSQQYLRTRDTVISTAAAMPRTRPTRVNTDWCPATGRPGSPDRSAPPGPRPPSSPRVRNSTAPGRHRSDPGRPAAAPVRGRDRGGVVHGRAVPRQGVWRVWGFTSGS